MIAPINIFLGVVNLAFYFVGENPTNLVVGIFCMAAGLLGCLEIVERGNQ